MLGFSFKADAHNVAVIGVGAASQLTSDQLMVEANKVCAELKIQHDAQRLVLRHFVHLDRNMVGVLMERAGKFAIFIGLGLDVIQAAQEFTGHVQTT